jgi:hypothetical protein
MEPFTAPRRRSTNVETSRVADNTEPSPVVASRFGRATRALHDNEAIQILAMLLRMRANMDQMKDQLADRSSKGMNKANGNSIWDVPKNKGMKLQLAKIATKKT